MINNLIVFEKLKIIFFFSVYHNIYKVNSLSIINLLDNNLMVLFMLLFSETEGKTKIALSYFNTLPLY